MDGRCSWCSCRFYCWLGFNKASLSSFWIKSLGRSLSSHWYVLFFIIFKSGSVNNLLGLGVHACQFVKMERTISTALFIFQFNRALVFCSCSIYVKCRYPSQVYGSMMGIVYVSLGRLRVLTVETSLNQKTIFAFFLNFL